MTVRGTEGERKFSYYPSASLDSAMVAFNVPSQPLQEKVIPPPGELLDNEKAKKQIVAKSTINIDPDKIPPERKVILSKIQKSCGFMIDFAKKHPFLTGAFVLGIIFLFCAFPTLASALADKGGITLFHAQMTVGLGAVLGTIYYGCYLINLARRASLKDTLQAQVESLTKREESLSPDSLDEEFRKKIIQDAAYIETESQEKITIIKEEYKLRARLIQETQKTQEKLQKTKDLLETHIHSSILSQMPQELQESARKLSQKLTREIERGAELMNTKVEELETIIHPPKLVLEIPEIPTPQQIKNQEIQKKMGEKLKEFFSEIGSLVSSYGTMMKEHPGSTFVGILGTLFTLLSIPALAYWLSGYQSVYLIGSLGLLGAFHFIVYGLSLIYEGYNSATIAKLEKELNALNDATEEHTKTNRQASSAIEKIKAQAQSSFEKYQEDWSKAIKAVQENANFQLQKFETPDTSDMLFKEFQHFVMEFFTAFGVPPTNMPEQAQQAQVLQSPFSGAQILSPTYRSA